MRSTEKFCVGYIVYFLTYKLVDSDIYWLVDYSDNEENLYERILNFKSGFERYYIFCERIEKECFFKFKQFMVYNPDNSELIYKTKLLKSI
mgnify:CR=1 FL=1|tara:strand:- start:436 stop:708 length:273 start_codon:yes stop_codon:yes gene_type:complete